MKTNNKKSIVCFVLGGFLSMFSSCSDGFFDLQPSNEVTTKNLFTTAKDFDLAVIGCYSKLQTQAGFYSELSEFRSDNLWLSAPTTGTQDRYDIDQFADKPSNGILEDAWANFNNGVYRANMILDRIDAASFDNQLRMQYKGEALFIRALTYFNMYRIWGGVPTTNKTVSPAEALLVKRSTPEEMYQFISSDLKSIVEEGMLPDNYSGQNTGRATMGAAKALLGKVYLTFGKYAEAKDILSGLIGKYELLPLEQTFDVNRTMNKEIIFAVRYNKTEPGEGHGAWFSIGNLSDDSNQTAALLSAFEPGDVRKDMITYQQAATNLYVIKKLLDTRDPSTKQMGNDQILLRYADVLLMYAEALNEVAFSNSTNSEQFKILNQIRERAQVGNIPASELASQDAFRRAILLERQREFPYEGHRWFDLVRMGYAKEVMAAQGINIQDYQLLYPIPQTAIERVNNHEILWQNPGYN